MSTATSAWRCSLNGKPIPIGDTMCDVDYTPSFQETSQPTARKRHRCDACGEAIEPKQRYVRIFCVWEGEPMTIKHCRRCNAISDALFAAGAETVDFELDCGETWESAFGVSPPDDVAALAFAIPADFPSRPAHPNQPQGNNT